MPELWHALEAAWQLEARHALEHQLLARHLGQQLAGHAVRGHLGAALKHGHGKVRPGGGWGYLEGRGAHGGRVRLGVLGSWLVIVILQSDI